MITIGSISREEAAKTFSFLAPGHRGRRTAIRELTHGVPEFVFWIYPDGRVHDARTSHRAHPPRGFEHIVEDEPDYGGFLRGRVVHRPVMNQPANDAPKPPRWLSRSVLTHGSRQRGRGAS